MVGNSGGRIIKIPFFKTDGKIPIIKTALANGIELYMIIDSGSETSLIDKEIVKQNKTLFRLTKTKEKANYIGISSSEKIPVIKVSTDIYAENNQFKFDAELYDFKFLSSSLSELYGISPSVLLGSDLLKTYNAKLDFEDDVLIMIYNDLPCQ